jgi:hypothetical protein
MNKKLQLFFDKTKQIHILLSSAMILILIIMVAPITTGLMKRIGQLVIIMILGYVFYQNFMETHQFSSKLKNEKASDLLIDMKNNVLASYALCAFIAILLLYITYSLFD